MSLYSQDDYAQSLHSLLPNGRAWPREKVACSMPY